MNCIKNRKLVLANGMVFEGVGFGSNKTVIAELVFNTSMVGYQEINSRFFITKKMKMTIIFILLFS